MSTGLVERPSGLFVPAHVKTEHTILDADFKKLRRLMHAARQHKMVAKFWCEECKAPVELKQEDRLVVGKDGKAPGGRFVLSCGCSSWAVR